MITIKKVSNLTFFPNNSIQVQKINYPGINFQESQQKAPSLVFPKEEYKHIPMQNPNIIPSQYPNYDKRKEQNNAYNFPNPTGDINQMNQGMNKQMGMDYPLSESAMLSTYKFFRQSGSIGKPEERMSSKDILAQMNRLRIFSSFNMSEITTCCQYPRKQIEIFPSSELAEIDPMLVSKRLFHAKEEFQPDKCIQCCSYFCRFFEGK